MRGTALGMAMGTIVAAAAWAQAPGARTTSTPQPTVETAPIELLTPDRYQVPIVLEPSRRVFIAAMADGIVRGLSVAVGATVRESQEIAQLDRAESLAHLKIAQAQVKEMEGEVDASKAAAAKTPSAIAIATARLEAARGRAELAQLELDRCTLKAPFAGRVLSIAVSPGQFVAKGSTIAELAEVSSLRVLLPVDRTATMTKNNLDVVVEGKGVTAKVQAIVPLPESWAILRELATPWASAWLMIANNRDEFEPGQRVRGPFIPQAPITVLPARALKMSEDPATGPMVQVIRNDVVTVVSVHVLGEAGPERKQVSGPFRPYDLAIVESSSPLAAGTFIRFAGDNGNAAGGSSDRPAAGRSIVDVTPSGGSRVAPIGAPSSAIPKAGSRPPAAKAPSSKSSSSPANPPARPSGTPF